MLREKLRELFRHTSGGPSQPPSPTSVLLAELRPEDFDGGRPRIRQESLRSLEDFEARFAVLMGTGFAWVNMNYCGIVDGHGLVLIEHPRNAARAKGSTSVNFSGPPKCVADAAWDALAYVTLTL